MTLKKVMCGTAGLNSSVMNVVKNNYNLFNLIRFYGLCAVIIFLFPLIAESSSLLLDEINIISIQDMELRKEKETYFIAVTFVVRNSGKSTLKFTDSDFKLSFAPTDAEEISIGSASEDEILLERKGDLSYTDTNLQFLINISNDIKQLHLNIISSEEMSSQLTEPKPKLNLHIQGDFGLGVKLKQGWMYLKGVTIDWVITVDVPRDVFVRTYKEIESAADGEVKASDDIKDALFDAEEDELFEKSSEPKNKREGR